MLRGAMVSCLLVLVGQVSNADTIKPPSGIAAQRNGWFYSNGAFRKIKDNIWEEKNPNESFEYLELDRNEHYVELYDRSRKLSIRLYYWGMYAWNRRTEKWHLVRPGRWDDPRKKPLDTMLNSTERSHLQTSAERSSFPRLGDEFEVLAPASPSYNCIAWALGFNDRWIWPKSNGEAVTISDFDALFNYYGYKRLPRINLDPVAGYDKLVLYARRTEFGDLEPTHCARQLPDGSWSSKLGKLPLIRHLHPDDINGETYGEVSAVYVREKPTKSSKPGR